MASGSTVTGRLELVAGSAGAIQAGELADGLVYFLPKAGAPKPKPGTFTIDTRSKGFSPSLLVVPQGSTVRFPNRDTILHNVFSRTPGSTGTAAWARMFCCCWADTAFWNRMPVEWAMLW